MSAPVHAKAAENTTKPEDTKSAPQLGALEEDDEFEEFAAEGINRIARNLLAWAHTDSVFSIDWEETEEDTEDAHFWEDNWDDDDVEDDFSKQLRLVNFVGWTAHCTSSNTHYSANGRAELSRGSQPQPMKM